MTKQKNVRIGELEKLNGRLMHGTIGIPNEHDLLSPLIALIAKKEHHTITRARQSG